MIKWSEISLTISFLLVLPFCHSSGNLLVLNPFIFIILWDSCQFESNFTCAWNLSLLFSQLCFLETFRRTDGSKVHAKKMFWLKFQNCSMSIEWASKFLMLLKIVMLYMRTWLHQIINLWVNPHTLSTWSNDLKCDSQYLLYKSFLYISSPGTYWFSIRSFI